MKYWSLLSGIAMALLAAAGCVNKPDHDGGPGGDGPNDKKTVITAIMFEKKNNPSLEADLPLEIYENGIVSGYVRNRGVDVTRLVATFVVTGEPDYVLTVGGREQRSGVTQGDFSREVVYRLAYGENGVKQYRVQLVPYTGLPVTVICTEDGKLPASKEIWCPATMAIDGLGASESFAPQAIEIKRRGNSTFGWPKKPFNIRLGAKQPVLGMNKQKRWALLANHRDRTLLRNDVSLYIGQRFDALGWTPHAQYTEMIFNGEYVGNYQITEQIRVDKNRVNITEMTAADTGGDALTGGYLLEFDGYNGEEINTFSTAEMGYPVTVKEPDEDVLGPVQFDYITGYVNQVEALLSEGRFDEAYDYIDVDSYVDYWLVQLLVGNTEAGKPFSYYMHKDRGGKLVAGPLWDFDYSTFNSRFAESPRAETSVWHPYLVNDPVYKAKVKARFAEMLPFLRTVPDYIRTQQERLRASAAENWKLWKIETASGEAITGNDDETLSSDEAIDRMVAYWAARLAYVERYLRDL
ncbi:MAG: CotH kinase family protein [Rikenellaceae bacterium]|nr:CotH kinase family protein [Rikenellaceae bacterium]